MRAAPLPLAGLLAGGWALLPPYTGPALNTAMRVEVADHVVPGVIVLLVSAATLAMAWSRRTVSGAMLVAGAVVLLAGLWMTATHVPLVLQATRDEAPGAAAAYHSVPGVAVALLGAVWMGTHWAGDRETN